MEISKKLSIKGMVCSRCIQVVYREFEKTGFRILGISLGNIEVAGISEPESYSTIEKILNENGLKLIYSKEERIVREIKKIIEEEFNSFSLLPAKQKVTESLCNNIPYSYDYMSEIFSSVEAVSLEKYIIGKRLEIVKALLLDSNKSITEIAYITGFSSVHHLSNQFKEQTGFAPTHLRSKKAILRLMRNATKI